MKHKHRSVDQHTRRTHRLAFEWMAGLSAALATWLLLEHGWSAFDDGVYAWVARRLLDDAVPYADVVLQRPVYVIYLDAWLFAAFGEDIVVLRYPLPLLAAVMVASLTGLARGGGTAMQAVTALAATSFGIVQFITPSANWFATTLACAAAWSFCSGQNPCTASRMRWWLFSGMLIGACAGFRQVNGALLLAGLVLLHLTSNRSHQSAAPGGGITFAGMALIALCVVAIPAVMSNSMSTWYLTLPAIALAAMAIPNLLGNYRHGHGALDLWPLLAGCGAGFMPAMIIPAAQGNLWGFFDNVVLKASAFAQYSSFRGSEFTTLLVDAFELFAANRPYAWAGALYLFGIALLPLIYAVAIYANRNTLDDRYTAALAMLGAVSLLGSTSYQGLLYVFFWLPQVIASILMLIRFRTTACRTSVGVAVALFSLLALTFHSGRLPGSSVMDVLSDPSYRQVDCGLPRCTLKVDPGIHATVQADYADLMANVAIDKPLLVLPSGAAMYSVLPHRSPWSISFVMEGFTPDSEIDHLRKEVELRRNSHVAVSDNYLATPGERTSMDDLISSLCLWRDTPRHRIYKHCDA